jgi:hypothetical protein
MNDVERIAGPIILCLSAIAFGYTLGLADAMRMNALHNLFNASAVTDHGDSD